MPFTNPILGGTALVRSAIKSPNYIPGTAGWSINADGSAEFTNLKIDGSDVTEVTITFTDGSQIHLYAGSYMFTGGSTSDGAWITFLPKAVAGRAWMPGAIGALLSNTNTSRANVAILSPFDANRVGDTQSQITLRNKGDNADGLGARIDFVADSIIGNLSDGMTLFGSFWVEDFAGTNLLFQVTGGNISLTPAVTAGATTGVLTMTGLDSCSVNQIITVASSGSWQTVSYPVASEEWNIHGVHGSTNPTRLTAQRTGIHELSHYVNFNVANGTGLRGSCYLLNGNALNRLRQISPVPNSSSATGASWTGRVLMNAGDEVEHQIFQSSGSTFTSNVNTNFQLSYVEGL